MLEALLRLTCALVTVAGLGLFGWTSTLRLETCARLTRWTAAFVASAFVATVVFLVLAFARLVGLPSLLVASLAFGAAGVRIAGRERIASAFAADVAAIREVPKRVGKPVLAVLAIVLGAHLLLAAAAACSPPLGFDSLMYHLVHIVYWAQDGGLQRHAGVDAWGYYEFFPIGGEVLWAWVAIPTRSSVLVGPAGVFLSMMTAASTISAARSIGATLERAALAAAALVALPPVFAFATTGYVDNTALAFVASGTALFLAATSANPPLRRVLVVGSAAAFGLAVAAKTTMLSMLGLGLVASAVLLVARRTPVRETAGVLVASFSAAALMFVPRMVYVASATGSPLYPFPFRLFGREISRGNLQLQKLFAEAPTPVPSTWALLRELFFVTRPKAPVNFGLSGFALFLAGAIGLACFLRLRPRDGRVLFIAALAMPALTFFFGESTQGFRSSWWWVIARFMTTAAFAAALFASASPNRRIFRIVDLLLGFAALAGAFVPLTNGMCGYRWIGAVAVAGAFAGVVALGVFVSLQGRSTSAAGVPFVALVGVVGIAAMTLTLRGELEGLIARGAARGECYEAHAGPRAAAGFPLWERLADAAPARIAVASGFDGIGHEGLRYPLFGRRWQHELVYVSPASDGSLYDHPALYSNDEAGPRLSFEMWRARLREARVDYVVLVGPYNVAEHRWLVMHPEQFRLEEVSAVDAARLYSIITR